MADTDLSALAHALAEPVFVLGSQAERLNGDGTALRATAKQLRVLLDGVVRLDRAGDEPQPEPVALGPCLERAAAVARESGVDVTVAATALPIVQADPTQVVTLLTELLENAARFCGRDHVLVTVAAAPLTPGWTRVVLSDDGPGIPGEDPERAFKPFRRLDPNLRTEFAGVGLAVCRRIVEGHRGTIVAATRPCGGTALTFTLPSAD